jgi:transcriptional regulator with XRE-family HTH domain
MPVTERRADRGARLARIAHQRLGQELRTLRRLAGLSQRRVAEEVGMDHSVVSRIETGACSPASLDVYSRLFAVVGARLSIKTYPDGEPLRDHPQQGLIGRMLPHVHVAIGVQREVGMGLPGDLRAWDVVLTVGDDWCAIDAETILDDLQALERKIALKQQDSGAPVVHLLVSGTDRNRRILRANREALRARFPLDTREALGYLRRGELPPKGAIIVL